MANGLQPQVVDIPLLLPNQTPGKHAGPIGRLTSMVNAQIRHFLPSSQQAPQRITVEPRDGFTALTTNCRDAASGAVIGSPDWNNPELLAPLGNQLLSICDSVPRVNSGVAWSYYGNQRVLTQQLSEDVFHTTNHTLQAPDSAYLPGVTCMVWTETTFNGPVQLNTSMVAFRSDDGAWIRTPASLFQNNSGNALVRVVQDGTFFSVVFNTGNKIAVNVFDTHGVLVAFDSTTISLKWTPTPGYWDIGAFNNAGSHYILIAQPNGFSSIGSTVGVNLLKCTVSGSVITIASSVPAMTGDCSGPLAFVDSTATGFPSLETIAVGTPWVTEFSHALAETHAYSFGAIMAGSGIPDSLTGWMETNGAGAIAHIGYSLLSNFSPPAGPANDPGLRYTRSYACTRAGVVTLTNQVNGVLLSSRAFQIDNDWYAATYYQSGLGNGPSTSPVPVITDDTLDYFTGDVHQPVSLQDGDFASGAAAPVPAVAAVVAPTQLIASITHNGGDSAVAATRTWTLLNATFQGTGAGATTAASAQGGWLKITGSAHAENNASFWIQSVVSPTQVITDATSDAGTNMVDDTLIGVTASVTQGWAIVIPGPGSGGGFVNDPYPTANTSQLFLGGAAVITGVGGSGSVMNGTYNIGKIFYAAKWRGVTLREGDDGTATLFFLRQTSGSPGTAGSVYGMGLGTAIFTVAPLSVNDWVLSGLASEHDTRAGINIQLTVSGAQVAGNNGVFPETGIVSAYSRIASNTASQSLQRAEIFGTPNPLPSISRDLVDPGQAFQWHLVNLTLDPSYIGAIVFMGGAAHAEDNGLYEIVSLVPWVDAHTFIAKPIVGSTGQTLYNMTSSEVVTVTKSASSATPAYQPCWYLTPLSLAQPNAGRWEWSIAYADWRFDGAGPPHGTFERNAYPCALSSVVGGAVGKQFALPYRAQSFTAGQTITDNAGAIVGVQSTEESTVGLKLFTLANATGQASVNSGEMFIPGPQASAFSASGFTEHGINLGPEKPFLVSQSTDSAISFGLTLGSTNQYVVVWEVMSESGDRIWSVTSPPLDVTMQGTQNTAVIGGRMPGPTARVVGVALYRTANTGSPPTATIQHYKITNDLQVNGPGFTFTSVNGGATPDTWQFSDQVPDLAILSAQTLYTDQGFLQRFPAPAHRQSVASWENRTWMVGYDGAIWMSGEKTEGDDVWFHPAFRYVLPTDDKPVALASMDNYMLVFCSQSIWFIPAAQFPDATGANGTLPTPQPLPFRNGCTGYAVTLKDGVAYSSTAGGIWLINRSLMNVYLSQPLQNDIAPVTVNGMAIDGSQRLLVASRLEYSVRLRPTVAGLAQVVVRRPWQRP